LGLGVEGGGDEVVGCGLYLFEVVGVVEGFGVDFVDVFGVGGLCGELCGFCDDF